MLIHLSGAFMTMHAGSNLLLIPAAILTLASGGAASAQGPDAPVRVALGDLDFSSPRDVEVFRRRVDQAAGRLCGRQSQLDFYEMTACYRGVRRQCVRQLNDDQRRALFAASRKIRTWAGIVD